MGGRDDDAADLYRILRAVWLQEPRRAEQFAAIQQPQMQGVDILAVEFRIGAVLLDDEDVDAHPQEIVELPRGELIETLEIDLVGNRGHQ